MQEQILLKNINRDESKSGLDYSSSKSACSQTTTIFFGDNNFYYFSIKSVAYSMIHT